MKRKRVVITGVGVAAPNGVGAEAFNTALKNGESGIRHFAEHEELNFRCQLGGFPVPDQNYIESLLPLYYQQKVTNKGVINACLAGLEAWKSAGFELDADNRIPDAGMIIGAGALGWDNSTDWIQGTINEGQNKRLGSRVIPQNMNSGAAAFLNQLLGLGGKVYSNSSACISGSEAVLHGYQEIASGGARVMVVGGTEGEGRFSWGAFDAMRVLVSDSNDRPTWGSRPMSDSSAGFVPSGGSGVLILEALDSALERGAEIYAEIKGGAQNCGGMRNGGSMTAPNSAAVVECIENAVANTEIEAESIDLISGHLTSTKADPIEIANWQTALKLSGEQMPMINTPKSMIGHGIAAAGAIESIACVLQIKNGYVHPNINLTPDNIHPKIAERVNLDKIPLTTTEFDVKTIIKANFGFGDLNCCLVFRKFEA